MKTRLLYLLVFFLVCVGASSQNRNRGWMKHTHLRGEHTLPTTSLRTSPNTPVRNAKATSLLASTKRGASIPTRATRVISHYNGDGQLEMIGQEYYEYDAYGNVILYEPDVHEKVVSTYDPKSNGRLLLNRSYQRWDYPLQTWVKSKGQYDYSTVLNAEGIRTAVRQSNIVEATFNEKGYVTYLKEVDEHYKDEYTELRCTWKDDFPSTISTKYIYKDYEEFTTLTNIVPMYAVDKFNPYQLLLDDWEALLFDGEEDVVFFTCDAVTEYTERGFTMKMQLRMECTFDEETNTYNRTVYNIVNQQEIPYIIETKKYLDQYGSYQYISQELDGGDNWESTTTATYNEHGDLIRYEEVDGDEEEKYSSLETYAREYDGKGNLTKTTCEMSNNGRLNESWIETYGERVVDRSVKEVTLTTPGTLREVLAQTPLESVFALKLNGAMNEEDYRVIGNMSRIHFLDLSSAQTEIIPDYFLSGSPLSSLLLPDGLKKIGSGAFQGCNNLSVLEFPTGLQRIGDYAFSYCSIDSLRLPNGLATINSYAFSGCRELTYVELPLSLNQIPGGFLNDCDRVRKIVCGMPAPPAPRNIDDCFRGIDRTTCKVVVPSFALPSYRSELNELWKQFSQYETYELASDRWSLSGHLILPEGVRLSGTPDIELNMGGGLLVSGNTPMEMKNLTMHQGEVYEEWGGVSSTDRLSVVVNSCKMLSAEEIQVVYACEAFKWYFVSFPFDVNPEEITVDNNALYALRRYDGAARAQWGAGKSWVNVAPGETLHAGQGYIIQFDSQVKQFTVKAMHNANKERFFANTAQRIPLNEYASNVTSNQGWNFIGNPYPCYYNIRLMDYTAPITVWNGYGYMALSLEDDSYLLSPMQAFFVQKPEDTAAISFPTEGRSMIKQWLNSYSDKTRASTVSDQRTIYNLTLGNDDYTDKTRIVINARFSLGYDMHKDAAKFMSNNEEVPQLFSLDAKSTRYAINERPIDTGIVALGVYIGKGGSYTFAMEHDADDCEDMVLVDKWMNREINLKNESYTFSAEPGTYSERFEVRIATGTGGGGTTGLPDGTELQAPKVFSINGQIVVKTAVGNEVAVYAVTGQCLMKLTAHQADTSIPMPSGAYMVTVNGQSFKTMVTK